MLDKVSYKCVEQIKQCLIGVLNIQSFEAKSMKHEAAKLLFHFCTASSLKNLNYC